MPSIRVIVDGETTATHPLVREAVTLGRDPSNTVVLHDKTASTTHAQITATADGWQIEDLRSTNGTLLNGRPVQSAYLHNGDYIYIGTTEIVFEDELETSASSAEGTRSSGFLQSILSASSSGESEELAYLPSLVIDDAGASPDEESDLAFVDVEPQAIPQHTIVIPEIPKKSTATTQFMRRGAPEEGLAETKLRLVQRVSEQLVRIFEPQQLLDEIMSIVVEQTGADRGLLCLLDDAGQPVPIAARGIRGEEQIRVSRTVLGRILNGRTGVLISPSPNASDAYRSLAEMQVQSTMCVPLWIGDKIVGLLSLDSVTPGKIFSQTDLELLLAVAHQVAVGIERSRLGHQIETERQLRDYLSKYLDHRIVEQISQGQTTGQDPLAPAEREVTILFADIVSFTKLSESLDVVELATFVRKFLTAMTEVIFSYGGTIDKYIGDAVMALFGAPVKSDNSAEAAIRAALVMRERMKELELPGARGKNIFVRVGINTGPVVVGNLGSERRSEYTALGDAVNVASRLEAFARPNEICIDEYTYDKTKGAFEVEEIGTIDVKNRAEPVTVYKVIAERQ